MSEVGTPDDAPMPMVVLRLISISKTIRALNAIKLADLGFHNGQDEYLMAVESKGITSSSVASQLSIRPSTVSKMTDRLVAKGLVERVSDQRDKRKSLVKITSTGVKARERLSEVRRKLDDEVISGITEGDRATVVDVLVQCQLHLASRLKRLR